MEDCPDEFARVIGRFSALSKVEKERLDPIAAALNDYFETTLNRPRISVSRVVALAAVEVALAWEKAEFDRE